MSLEQSTANRLWTAAPSQLQPTVELHINALVLDGFAAQDRAQLGAAVEAELAQLLNAGVSGESFLNSLEFGRIDGGQFNLPASGESQAIGKQIAAQIFGALAGSIES